MKKNKSSMNKMYYVSIFLFLLTLGGASFGSIAQERPEDMLRTVTSKMLETLKSHDNDLKTNPGKIYGIVDEILVPHMDAEYMAKWVIGRDAWTNATSEQRARFTQAFKRTLVRTYASTLLAYSNQIVEYFPIRGDISGKSRVQVSSVIKEPNGETINVAYRLVNADSQWKVYDIIIEGISILQGFQSQFSQELRQGEGFEKIIQRIEIHNRKPL